MATRAQANSRLWPKFRADRVAESRLYKLCHTDPSQPAPINEICCLDRHLSRGIRKEKNAKVAYRKKIAARENFSMRDSRFVIHSAYPEIGASRGGIIRCDCCGEGCLDVTCPFLVRDEDRLNMKEGATCLIKDESAPEKGTRLLLPGAMPAVCVWPHLRRLCCMDPGVISLFVCGHTYGDSVVWTQKSYHCLCVATLMETLLYGPRSHITVCVWPHLWRPCCMDPGVISLFVCGHTYGDSVVWTQESYHCLCVATLMETLLYGPRSHITVCVWPHLWRLCCMDPGVISLFVCGHTYGDSVVWTQESYHCLCVATLMETLLYGPRSHITVCVWPHLWRLCCMDPEVISLFVCGHTYGDSVVWTQESYHCLCVATLMETLLYGPRSHITVCVWPHLWRLCCMDPEVISLFVCGHTYGDSVVWTQKSYHCLCVATLMETLLYGPRSHITVCVWPHLWRLCCMDPEVISLRAGCQK